MKKKYYKNIAAVLLMRALTGAFLTGCGAKDLDGFDLQAVAEQMYDPANEINVP